MLYARLIKAMENIISSFEIIIINDASPMKDWEVIQSLAISDTRIKGINLSRNFGQHYAITAGLENSSGEWVVVMDCDLQDQPEEIVKLYNKALEGFDIVFGSRVRRKDTFMKKLFSRLFYALLGYLTKTKQDITIGNFGIYHNHVIKAILTMKDSIRYFPSMVQWVGFKNTSVPVEHAEREIGKTSYNIINLINLALDVMLAFSDKPLRLTVKIGFFMALFSFLFAIVVMFRYFFGDIKVGGWTSLIVSIWFLSGVIIFIIGIAGLYIGKTFEKVKERPLFIIKDKINFPDDI
ncbi:MAG: glycosyltransferase family 2 protein [Bacteroidia bacterium]|nr:glycosyltransferase family 2 protein [Bacteroidia bacterium]